MSHMSTELQAITACCTGSEEQVSNCRNMLLDGTSSLYTVSHPALSLTLLHVMHGSVKLYTAPLPSCGTLISADCVL